VVDIQSAAAEIRRGKKEERKNPKAEPYVRPISCHVASLSWQEPEEEFNKLLLMKVSDRERNVKVKMLVVKTFISP